MAGPCGRRHRALGGCTLIFVTVGSAFPFDRLIQSMDNWAQKTGRGSDCLAQIGRGSYKPSHIAWQASLSHADFDDAMRTASVGVAHAGMGSVITSMRHATPIVMLPRRFEQCEHTTDHQIATARWLEDKPGVFIAWQEDALASKIADAESWKSDATELAPFAPASFTDRIAAQLHSWTAD